MLKSVETVNIVLFAGLIEKEKLYLFVMTSKKVIVNMMSFSATFDISLSCASLDLLRDRANKPDFVSIKGMTTFTKGYEIMCENNNVVITVSGIIT